jgi:outer membrane lipoprotein-sorting protein
MTHRLLLSSLGLVILCLAACSSKEPAGSVAKESSATAAPFPDEPAAHALYNQMLEAMQKADSLSFASRLQLERQGKTLRDFTYQAWLKKPNYFRIEAESNKHPGKGGGVIIGDGEEMWSYWPHGCPEFDDEDHTDGDGKTPFNVYKRKLAPFGGHSLYNEFYYLGIGTHGTVLELSTFLGSHDRVQPFLDGVRSLGTERIDGDDCDQIEVSFMSGERTWYLWLAKADHLPRKLRENLLTETPGEDDFIKTEEWSKVTLNADIPQTMFAWTPPEDWREWKRKKGDEPKERFLKPGTQAPDFDLASADGKRIRLSDYRGQIVWLYFWVAG